MSTTHHYITWTAQDTAETFSVVRGEGVFYIEESGKKIYDATSTSFQASFGHSTNEIVDSISNQLTTLPICYPKGVFNLKEKASEQLINLLGLGDGKIFYTVSGAESIENALKICRQISKKKIILARKKSYHGATLGALSITGDWRRDAHFTVDEWTHWIPEPIDDPECLYTEKIIDEVGPENIAAFCLEVISGANGVIIPQTSWWQGIARICDKYKLLLIADEVLTGFCRTGKPFALMHYGIKPDLVCMSKAISGGYIPFGAVWTNAQIANYYNKEILSCGLTNYAHPLGIAAMHGVINLINNPQFLAHISQLEETFSSHLSQIAKNPLVKEVRVKGMLAAIEFKESGLFSWMEFVKEGVHLFVKPNLLLLAPPLISSKSELIAGLTIINQIINRRDRTL